MPLLEQQVSCPRGAVCFGSYDILSGFDYLPVAEESRRFFVIVTSYGCYEMCGSPQGWVNTPQLCQDRMVSKVLNPLDLFCRPETGVIQWVDDPLLHSSSFEDCLEALSRLLDRLIEKRLRLNISKCEFLGRRME